jgi:hypothetical protein
MSPRCAHAGVLAGIAIALAACSSGDAASRPRGVTEARAPPSEELASTAHSGYRARTLAVIRSSREALAAWQRIWALQAPAPPFPAVDFSREMLVLAALGERGSAGYSVAVSDAVAEGSVLQIGIVETRPGEGCVTASVVTSPAVLAKLPRHEGRVELVEFVVTEPCPGERQLAR